jgi:hypothetical protein
MRSDVLRRSRRLCLPGGGLGICADGADTWLY